MDFYRTLILIKKNSQTPVMCNPIFCQCDMFTAYMLNIVACGKKEAPKGNIILFNPIPFNVTRVTYMVNRHFSTL